MCTNLCADSVTQPLNKNYVRTWSTLRAPDPVLGQCDIYEMFFGCITRPTSGATQYIDFTMKCQSCGPGSYLKNKIACTCVIQHVFV